MIFLKGIYYFGVQSVFKERHEAPMSSRKRPRNLFGFYHMGYKKDYGGQVNIPSQKDFKELRRL